MQPTNEQRLKLYSTLPQEVQLLYSSDEAMRLTQRIVQTYAIPEEKKPAYLDVTGDVILGLRTISELPLLLQARVGVGADAAQRITTTLIDHWGPVVQREGEHAAQKKAEFESLTASFADQKATPAPQHNPEKPAVPNTPEDPQRIHGYGSLPHYQDDPTVIRSLGQDELRGR